MNRNFIEHECNIGMYLVQRLIDNMQPKEAEMYDFYLSQIIETFYYMKEYATKEDKNG